jgi:glycosyltransferase involved in cell wall biosynthesis
MKLSIIIPVYNEEKTIIHVLHKVNDLKFTKIEKEIIVINDGSQDQTHEQIKQFEKTIFKEHQKNFKYILHKKNQGKGAAVKTGIMHATGEYIVIQDADLEYDPQDIKKLLTPIQSKKAKVVYGTRLKRLPNISRDERTPRFMLHYLGNKGLSLLTSILYGHWVTDMETCYKLFPKNALENVPIHARGFELEPEITAKLLKKGYKIVDVPISTNPRNYKEGKKLNTVRDGAKALWYLIKYRFVD